MTDSNTQRDVECLGKHECKSMWTQVVKKIVNYN